MEADMSVYNTVARRNEHMFTLILVKAKHTGPCLTRSNIVPDTRELPSVLGYALKRCVSQIITTTSATMQQQQQHYIRAMFTLRRRTGSSNANTTMSIYLLSHFTSLYIDLDYVQ